MVGGSGGGGGYQNYNKRTWKKAKFRHNIKVVLTHRSFTGSPAAPAAPVTPAHRLVAGGFLRSTT